MIEIDDALCAALTADTALVTMLGGPSFVSSQWPAGTESFSDLPSGVTDYTSLQPSDPPWARVTLILLVPDEDPETPSHQDQYQVDVWSHSSRLNAAIARRIKQILDRGGLSVPGYLAQETYCTYGPDLFEPTDRLHHKVLNYHVTWTGSA